MIDVQNSHLNNFFSEKLIDFLGLREANEHLKSSGQAIGNAAKKGRHSAD